MSSSAEPELMRIAVCLKFVDRRPEADATGAVVLDERFAGVSPADQAALEWALTLAHDLDVPADDVAAITYGPSAADRVMRDALACGAGRALRIDGGTESTSACIAEAIAEALALDRVGLVVCGDYSADRGSGSVPAFIAAHLGVAAALGLLHLAVHDEDLVALRRLDGGRRERLRVSLPAVVSVEGGTARLRRASLSATIRAASAQIDVVTPSSKAELHSRGTTHPYRPRSRALAAPEHEDALSRIIELTGAGSAAAVATSSTPIVLEPGAAADRILAALAYWGYDLPGPSGAL